MADSMLLGFGEAGFLSGQRFVESLQQDCSITPGHFEKLVFLVVKKSRLAHFRLLALCCD